MKVYLILFSFFCYPQWKGCSEVSCKPLAEMSQNEIFNGILFRYYFNL